MPTEKMWFVCRRSTFNGEPIPIMLSDVETLHEGQGDAVALWETAEDAIGACSVYYNQAMCTAYPWMRYEELKAPTTRPKDK